MFSMLAIVQTLGFVIGPIVCFFFYPATDDWYAGGIYFLLAALLLTPLPLML